MGLNNHVKIKEEVQNYQSAIEHLQEELARLKEMREQLNEPMNMTIDLSEPKDLMEAARKYEQELKTGEKDPVMYMYKDMMIEIVFEAQRELSKKLPLSFLTSIREKDNLEDLLSYALAELTILESKLYSLHLDEFDCLICGERNLVLDETRGEQTCKNCGTVSREKMIEEEIIH
ncbi:MAG: TFIIB-type zinc ribbon-containing protein [Candidatus Heimdallarchaeota archaeon]|nr:TFIIB-type zinc ribbon-containing protein [Candidatus Heimdallarchaeota archaeon]